MADEQTDEVEKEDNKIAHYDWQIMLQTLYASYHQDDKSIPENKRLWKNYEGKSKQD